MSLEQLARSASSDDQPVWLVTGAARGVGRILAEMALRQGNRVAATADRLEDLWPLIDSYESMVIPSELDVTDEFADRETVQRVVEITGRLDVVVNAAGILRAAHTEQMGLDLWNQIIGINLTGTFLVVREALPAEPVKANKLRILALEDSGLLRKSPKTTTTMEEVLNRGDIHFADLLAKEHGE